ncbi:MAG: hypothetical protein QGH73_18615 [Rhodospirillales bacterium]|jgi:hypothetical protein|nr:hypothetical protein [Rhodospirillaceae bacterium]MDP6429046.1 hypothetical protein [Rhodospirillales bacterium]MDP6644248.1 hypothetical protein [Rhodospirillales bacterium]MDP6843688.1 hypothetical protein [Rhodospirillales bacterium]|tara:strand:- start:896 stop:1120 length:225 start_codon:yes stop_codon:yes gene_type:complete
MTDSNSDDIDDASTAIWRVSDNLRLAGVETDAVANALLGRGILLKLMEGASVEALAIEVDEIIGTLARHLADRQ